MRNVEDFGGSLLLGATLFLIAGRMGEGKRCVALHNYIHNSPQGHPMQCTRGCAEMG